MVHTERIITGLRGAVAAVRTRVLVREFASGDKVASCEGRCGSGSAVRGGRRLPVGCSRSVKVCRRRVASASFDRIGDEAVAWGDGKVMIQVNALRSSENVGLSNLFLTTTV
jgi:hypothetical protein